MSDVRLLEDIAVHILESIYKVERRFRDIKTPDDFLRDDEGIDRLDGIVLMLITVGENLKRFEKYGGKQLLDDRPDVDWKGAIGVRDFLSHHYFDLDAEVIFNICADHVSELKHTMADILKKLNN